MICGKSGKSFCQPVWKQGRGWIHTEFAWEGISALDNVLHLSNAFGIQSLE